MNEFSVTTKSYDFPPVNFNEIYRYAGGDSSLPEFTSLVNECLSLAKNKFVFNVCYTSLPVNVTENTVILGDYKIKSNNLSQNLIDCKNAVIFGATIGIEIDRLITKYGKTEPIKGLIFQSIGAERIEALCNMFNDEISAKENESGKFTKPRFSPGYGDFALENQKEIIKLLSTSKNIGLTLNESLLLSPSKSVTGIIGITDKKCEAKLNCNSCKKTDCEFRRSV